MNKELYIKRENKLNELNKLRVIVRALQDFLENNENNFKKEESVEVLKRIREYYEVKQKEYDTNEEEEKKIYKELYSTCNHEVSVKWSNRPAYRCLICECAFDEDGIPINEIALISVDTTKDYEVAYIIEDIFKDIVHSDKDLVETINDAVEDLQYERNIKVYRRTKWKKVKY